jgi:hypothetical protein
VGGLKQGERVLIHAAAGGVGIAATQIAKRIGAEVFGTASASKHDAIREQGVDHAIDYRSQDFAEVGLRGELLFGVAHPLAGDPHAGGLALQGAGDWRDCSFPRRCDAALPRAVARRSSQAAAAIPRRACRYRITRRPAAERPMSRRHTTRTHARTQPTDVGATPRAEAAPASVARSDR